MMLVVFFCIIAGVFSFFKNRCQFLSSIVLVPVFRKPLFGPSKRAPRTFLSTAISYQIIRFNNILEVLSTFSRHGKQHTILAGFSPPADF
jgi:hypothetical protein